MFPWSPEFVLDPAHLVFFGALYGVIATVVSTIVLAGARARHDARAGRAAAIAWHVDFEELPAARRACRHQLTGRAPGRVCEEGFDCRRCATHARLGGARDAGPQAPAEHLGLDLPPGRLYHRGHTWVRPEDDGTLTVGLDDFARRLLGARGRVELPVVGNRLVANGPALTARARGREVRVLSPVDGTVVATGGEGPGATLRVDAGKAPDTRHLLEGIEVQAWMLREIERLQGAVGGRETGALLADGGELVADVGAEVPAERYDALLGDVFLEP
jgi:Glycine cleavage H-protein